MYSRCSVACAIFQHFPFPQQGVDGADPASNLDSQQLLQRLEQDEQHLCMISEIWHVRDTLLKWNFIAV